MGFVTTASSSPLLHCIVQTFEINLLIERFLFAKRKTIEASFISNGYFCSLVCDQSFFQDKYATNQIVAQLNNLILMPLKLTAPKINRVKDTTYFSL
jgi:hypothetical protein